MLSGRMAPGFLKPQLDGGSLASVTDIKTGSNSVET